MKLVDGNTRVLGRPARERGFTLMELLVSMTVISLLALSILFGWRVAASAWGRANQLVDEQRRVAAVHDLLARQMAEMVPVAPGRELGNTAVFFQGEPLTARFLSRYSLSQRSRSGLYRVEYHLAEEPDGGQQLLLNEFPVANASGLTELVTGSEQGPEGVLLRFVPFERIARTRILLEGLDEARLEYYRPARAGEPGAWVSEWRRPGVVLPRAMAIRFRAQPAPSRLPPTSIVANIEQFSGERP